MLEARRTWCKAGRPRGRTTNEECVYKSLKSEFRKCHRRHVEGYLASLDTKLEKEAGSNHVQFWRDFNARRKAKNLDSSAGIIFNGITHRGRDSLTDQWALYFKNLYSYSNSETFDKSCETQVTLDVCEVISEITPDPHAKVSIGSIEKAIRSLPTGKSGGPDGVVYEHLRFAQQSVAPVLANLFSQMLRIGYVPELMKRGIIITLHKGGKKRKDDPNNYRANTHCLHVC